MYKRQIDVTLSHSLPGVVKGWHVSRQYNAFDHNYIFYDLDLNMETIPPRRPWHRADWTLFTEMLRTTEYYIPDTLTQKKVDKLLKQVDTSINKALDASCPLTKGHKRDPANKWYNDWLLHLSKRVDERYQRQRRYPTPGNIDMFKRIQHKYKKECRKRRKRSWRIHMDASTGPAAASRLLRSLDKRERTLVDAFQTPDGGWTSPGTETSQYLLDAHFPQNQVASQPFFEHDHHSVISIASRHLDIATPSLVREALSVFQSKKSPGPDGFKPVLFDHLPDNTIRALTLIYQAILHLRYTPRQWRESNVVFLPKPGKPSYHVPEAYWPISLANYFIKCLERLCVWHVNRKLATAPLHPQQHGFCAERSTETATSTLVDKIESHIMKREHCIVVFLDIKSAFDSIQPQHIERCLRQCGVHPDVVMWYSDYIRHRNLRHVHNGYTTTVTHGTGFPQGGVCSARFWAVAFDAAVRLINEETLGVAFADDCAVASGGRDFEDSLQKLQRTLDRLQEWGTGCGLRFNPQKTTVVSFNRRRTVPPYALRLGNETLPYSLETKYLGLTLDAGLRWTAHVQKKVAAAKRLLLLLLHATTGNYGPRPRTVQWIYTGIVRPSVSYACYTWAHRNPTKAASTALQRLDRLALLSTASQRRSAPTQGLAVALGLLPLHLFLQQNALATLGRYPALGHLTWDGLSHTATHRASHRKYWTDLRSEANLPTITDRTRVTAPLLLFRVIRDSFSGANKYRQLSQINIYTDGSKSNTKVGAGYAIFEGSNLYDSASLTLPEYSTVFQAEVAAILRAAETVMDDRTSLRPRYVKIFSDSRAALLALTSRTIRTGLVHQTILALNRLAEYSKSLQLIWIRAHNNNVGNELADSLAKAGSDPNAGHPLLPVLSRLLPQSTTSHLCPWAMGNPLDNLPCRPANQAILPLHPPWTC